MNYEEDIAIDPDQLLEEWLLLPSTFFKYNSALTEATLKVNQLWEQEKTLRSELVLKAKEGGAKNEAEREAFYRTDNGFKKLKNEKMTAEYDRDMIQNVIGAFYRKEKALEAATTLMKMEYWMGPKEALDVPGGKRQVIEEMKNNSAQRRRARRKA